jgi:hypothetical protein
MTGSCQHFSISSAAIFATAFELMILAKDSYSLNAEAYTHSINFN